MSNSATNISAWLGRQQQANDHVAKGMVTALAATLDLDAEPIVQAGVLPPLWHWMFFNPPARQSQLGTDGHPARGGFLPAIELPNRMWAGSRLKFVQDIRIDEEITRHSKIIKCERKSGRNGDLVFVTVRHLINGENGLVMEEEHDIVYRNPSPKGAPLAGESITETPDFRNHIVPDPVLLFRYSALTFNGHRIHYDHPYTTQVEGYSGLVFHGPLAATFLLEGFRATYPDARGKNFVFRAVGPLFDNQTFDVCGKLTAPGQARLWIDCVGRLAMRADVAFEI